MRTITFLFLVSLQTLTAGPLILGVRAGLPFTDTIDTLFNGLGNVSSTDHFEVGPTLGIRLPLGFSVEGDALYKRETLNFSQSATSVTATTHLGSWEFPAMVKYTFGEQFFAPVVGAGVAVRHLNNFGDVPSFVVGNTSADSVGFVMGGGIRIKLGPLHITPELRYTRWGSTSLSRSVASLVAFNPNEASVLVGVTF